MNLIFRNWKIQLGTKNLSNLFEEESVEKNILKVYVHPLYDKQFSAAYYDAAVLLLNSPVTFDENIRPVCLPEYPSQNANEYSGSLLTVSGWGSAMPGKGNSSQMLKTAYLTKYDQR